MNSVVRMCPECRTTDASFPLIPGCQSCKDMLTQEEYDFWNGTMYWDEVELSDGSLSRISITPEIIMRWVVQPWKAFFDLITLA